MKNLFFRLTSILILITLFLSACSGASSSSTRPLRVGWVLWPGYYPLMIAKNQGLFEKRGVNVQPILYETTKEMTAALASGMVDAALMVLGDSMLDDVQEDIKITGITDTSDGADVIIASPDIKSVADLRGKRIGTLSGTYGEFFIQTMLDQNGLTRADVTFVEVSPDQVSNSIPSLIDAGATFEPYASQGRAKGFRIIFDSSKTPGLILDTIAFRQNTILSRPDDVQAFTDAWFEAAQFWLDNPAAGNTIIAQELNIPESDVSLEGVKLYTKADNLAAFVESDKTTSFYYTGKLENQFLLDRGIMSFPVSMGDAFIDVSFLK